MKNTVREIRKILFDSNKGVIMNGIEFTNKEIRDILYSFKNQEVVLEIIEIETLFIIR